MNPDKFKQRIQVKTPKKRFLNENDILSPVKIDKFQNNKPKHKLDENATIESKIPKLNSDQKIYDVLTRAKLRNSLRKLSESEK